MLILGVYTGNAVFIRDTKVTLLENPAKGVYKIEIDGPLPKVIEMSEGKVEEIMPGVKLDIIALDNPAIEGGKFRFNASRDIPIHRESVYKRIHDIA